MYLDMDFNYLASTVAESSPRKLLLQAFFWSTKLHRDVQPLLAKSNASAPKASEMTLSRPLFAHDTLKKSWMTFSVWNS
ncbi:MAG: hypothetical protein COB20_08935 [SAR86 cluster bacterium]|uniref:Uncharacterized protein n=1 Tax=SAR86 cluster bacterium TaxID=2030880 RepID=A0A2A4X4J8_9GAMM|nr:MAG: hypothetical protein COB20_08935 [SAR86 cluster bacterium]